MQFSVLDVLLVATLLFAAIVGGWLKVLSHELVAAMITAAVAFLAMRGKALFERQEKKRREQREDKAQADSEGTPDKPQEPGQSHRITISPDGTVTVEALGDEKVKPEDDTEPGFKHGGADDDVA